MKKKNVIALIAGIVCTAIVCSCATSAYIVNSIKNQTILSIKENNAELKKEILSDVDNKLTDKLENVPAMSEEDKEDLKTSIVATINEEMGTNNSQNSEPNTQIASLPPQCTDNNKLVKYIKPTITNNANHTYVTNTYPTTNVTIKGNETATDKPGDSGIAKPSGSSTVSTPDSYNFSDGKAIDVDTKLPLEIHPADNLTMYITDFKVEVYHHEGDTKGAAPFNLKFSVSGTFDIEGNAYVGFTKFPNIQITTIPDGYYLNLKGPSFDYDSKTFTCEDMIQVDYMPNSIRVTN